MSEPKTFWDGDWTDLPEYCPGQIHVMDQTIGCYDCGMNIWNMPKHGQWPKWDLANEPPADIWERAYDVAKDDLSLNPYTPYHDLLERTHPNGFLLGG